MSFSLSQVKGCSRRWKVWNKQEVSSSDQVVGRYCTPQSGKTLSWKSKFSCFNLFLIFFKEFLWGVLTVCPLTATLTQSAPSRSGHIYAGVQVRNREGKKNNQMDLFLGWKVIWTLLPQGGALCSSQSQALTVTWIWPRWMIVHLQLHHQQQHSKGFTQTVSHKHGKLLLWSRIIDSRHVTQGK